MSVLLMSISPLELVVQLGVNYLIPIDCSDSVGVVLCCTREYLIRPYYQRDYLIKRGAYRRLHPVYIPLPRAGCGCSSSLIACGFSRPGLPVPSCRVLEEKSGRPVTMFTDSAS